MVERFEHSSGARRDIPADSLLADPMKALGYDDSDPRVERAMDELKLEIEENDALRLQPCTSPVWDTAIVMNALA